MITIPSGVTIEAAENTVTVKGPKGKIQKSFGLKGTVSVSGNQFTVEGEKEYVNTVLSLVNSMIKGATEGFKKELKIIYAHFPISIEVKGETILIKNFQGEKMPRQARLIGDTKLAVKGQSVTVTGSDKEAVGQTIANMRSATKVKDRDARIFQDGIYIVG
jgi:large subunit ribosomal protein L6